MVGKAAVIASSAAASVAASALGAGVGFLLGRCAALSPDELRAVFCVALHTSVVGRPFILVEQEGSLHAQLAPDTEWQ